MKLLIFSCLFFLASVATAQTKTFFDFTAKDIDGNEVSMSKFKGKKILVVNVASECGNTPQYAKLQELYNEYVEENFIVVAFPANNFGEQEPGSNETIKQFCSANYHVTFPMMSKISVSGSDMDPIYRWLTSKSENGVKDAPVTWNFQKFMIDENGHWVGTVKPKVDPGCDEILQWLKS